MIDTGVDFSMYEELTIAGFSSNLAKRVADYYRPEMNELHELTKADAPSDLKEGYSHLTKAEKQELYKKFKTIVDDADRYAGNTKKSRKPRKKKEIPADKKISKLNYLKEHNELKLHSINPTKIIGATSLWTYNTKTKKLTVYHARGHAGLSIRGSTVIDFDVKTSETKTIGRVETNTLTKVLDGGKIILRRLMSEVNTKNVVVNGRINKDTILLRVIR
jgi:hypothetical protein